MGEWTGIMNDAYAAARMAQLKSDLADTWFAWRGPAEGQSGKNVTAYYRVQGTLPLPRCGCSRGRSPHFPRWRAVKPSPP
jgi:hypothetical protein